MSFLFLFAHAVQDETSPCLCFLSESEIRPFLFSLAPIISLIYCLCLRSLQLEIFTLRYLFVVKQYNNEILDIAIFRKRNSPILIYNCLSLPPLESLLISRQNCHSKRNDCRGIPMRWLCRCVGVFLVICGWKRKRMTMYGMPAICIWKCDRPPTCRTWFQRHPTCFSFIESFAERERIVRRIRID